MTVSSEPTLHRAERSDAVQDQGQFRTRFNFPGRAVPGHDDHGYGPLATVVESFLDPGTHIAMHPHRDEEIVSWVPDGVMRHGDRMGNDVVTDAEHLMVMNAGETFWHEEFTRADDPPLRMLQIFVRPQELGLEPTIQHEPLDAPVAGEWRHLFGPEDGDASLYVRNEVDCYDLRIDAGASVDLPAIAERDAYVYVFDGEIEVAGTRFGTTESGLLVGAEGLELAAIEDATVVAFLVDPDAPVTRQGTIGR